MSLGRANALDYVASKFRHEGGVHIARFEDVRNPDNKFMPLPGLHRHCAGLSKYDKVIFETEGDVAEVRMFMKGNGDIKFAEIRKVEPVKPAEPVEIVKPVETVVEKVVEKKDPKKKGISDEEKERRRVRMKEYWRKKKEGVSYE